MKRHPFQPFTALLGIALIILGVLVAVFGFEQIGDDALVWAAVAAGVVGLALIPWRGRRTRPT
jgi:membrane protease YdiL (CAAX protease family)